MENGQGPGGATEKMGLEPVRSSSLTSVRQESYFNKMTLTLTLSRPTGEGTA